MTVQNILFICGKNRRRSPTAEQIFAGHPGIEVASAGVSADADVMVTSDLIEWADTIFVMEKVHRTKLSARFKPNLKGTKIVCLDIPDRYGFMDPELIAQLRSKVGRHI